MLKVLKPALNDKDIWLAGDASKVLTRIFPKRARKIHLGLLKGKNPNGTKVGIGYFLKHPHPSATTPLINLMKRPEKEFRSYSHSLFRILDKLNTPRLDIATNLLLVDRQIPPHSRNKTTRANALLSQSQPHPSPWPFLPP